MSSIPAVSIWLHRAEGPTPLPVPVTLTGPSLWLQADLVLTQWGRTAPAPEDHAGVDKTDFIVTFADGDTYQGCYGLQRGAADLAGHMRAALDSYAHHGDDTMTAAIEAFLATYQLADVA